MRYRGSSFVLSDDKTYVRVRNDPVTFVEMTKNLLEFCNFDPRYFELYLDKAGALWVRKPAGTQRKYPDAPILRKLPSISYEAL
jgi:hypothetical protein